MSRLNLKNIIKNSEKIEPKSYCRENFSNIKPK